MIDSNTKEHTEIQKAKRHNMIYAATHGKGIFRGREYSEIRSAGYSFGGGAQFESQMERGLYNKIPITQSVAVDPIRLGSDNLAMPQSKRAKLSKEYHHYYQVADYGIQSGPLSGGREGDVCRKVPASLGLSSTSGHSDVDRLPATITMTTEHMMEGIDDVVPFENT